MTSPTDKARELIPQDMTTQHIVNRIAWLQRQLVDPYDVVGDHDEFKFTIFSIEEQNDIIEGEIAKLETELESRKS